MKEKTKNACKVEAKIDKVFHNRDIQFKSFSVSGRIPKHEHLAVGFKKAQNRDTTH